MAAWERQRTTRNRDTVSASTKRNTILPLSRNDGVADKIFGMQQTHGNQTVQHMASTCPAFPSACPTGGACHTCPTKIQTKLAISQPGDKYEQEADRVAEQVMRMPVVSNSPKPLHHSSSDISDAPPIVHEVIQSPGQPLDGRTRAYMEPRFGYDFSHVRIHADSKAMKSAQAINALAYTAGNDLVFNRGRYRPDTATGRELLGHELTHVVQQRQAYSNPNAPIIQRKVSYCCRDVQTGNSFLDIVSRVLGFEHCWLMTDTKTAGMGPAGGGPLPSWPFGVDTAITDHSGETSTKCRVIPNANEDCVNNALVIGTPTGEWGATNNCNTFAQGIIRQCGGSTDQLSGSSRRTSGLGPPSTDPNSLEFKMWLRYHRRM